MAAIQGDGMLSTDVEGIPSRRENLVRASAPRPEVKPALRHQRRAGLTGIPLLLARIGTALLILVAAQLLVTGGAVPSSAVASPSDTVVALVQVVQTAAFWDSLAATARTWGIGLAISMALAIPIGMILGSVGILRRMFRFTIDFLRTIPPVALIPLVLLLFGATDTTALVLIVFGSMWPMLLQSMYGVHQIDAVARDVTRSYRWRRSYLVFNLVLPSAAPFIATGIRIAATLSLLLAIGTELIGGTPGIGFQIGSAQAGGDIPLAYAYVVVSAILGVALNLVMIRIERKVLRWHSANR